MKYIDILISQLEYQDANDRKIKFNYYMINSILSRRFDYLIEKYLKENKIEKVIIYGAGSVGKVLFDKLKLVNSLSIIAVIDKEYTNNFKFDNTEVKLISDVKNLIYDTIIVTPVLYYETIKEELNNENALCLIPITDIFK